MSRVLVAYLVKRKGEHSRKQVADFLNRDPSVTVRVVEKVESKLQENNDLKQLVETLPRHFDA